MNCEVILCIPVKVLSLCKMLDYFAKAVYKPSTERQLTEEDLVLRFQESELKIYKFN